MPAQRYRTPGRKSFLPEFPLDPFHGRGAETLKRVAASMARVDGVEWMSLSIVGVTSLQRERDS